MSPNSERLLGERDRDGFGPYRVIDEVGQGGMGIVYLARDDEGREVAIKALEREVVADLDALRALRREVQMLTELRHPHIVRILDADLDDERPWYAMEYVDGQSLAAVMSEEVAEADTLLDPPAPTVATGEDAATVRGRGIASWDSLTRIALGWVVQVAHALGHMHGRGLIHGDLKPQNIVIAESRAVLIDFGLARRVEKRVSLDELRRAQSSAYTPAYAAPESFGSERVDPRADLYSLGCIIYEIVAGELPFEGSALEVILAHQREEPAPLSSIVDDVPHALDALVGRLLAKRPEDRSAHALDIVSSLESLGVSAPELNAPLPPVQPYLYQAPLIGRDEEVEMVTARARDVSGSSGAIIVLGESGVGKSTLALEAIKAGRNQKCRIITTSGSRLRPTSDAEPAIPFSGMSGVFNELVDFARTESASQVATILGDDALFLAPFDERLRRWCGREPPVLKDPIQAACRSLQNVLVRWCEHNGLLFVCDEVQWLDAASFRVFEEMLLASTEHPWLILGLARSEELELAETGPVADACEVIELGRLSLEATGATVAALLGRDSVESQVARLVYDRCGGNPYFIREFMTLAVQDGVLVLDEAGAWVGRDGVSIGNALLDVSDPLPVIELTRRRIAALPPEVARVARHAAVMGRQFGLGVLEAVMSDLDRDTFHRTLNELERQDFIEPAAQGASMRFTHDRLRESLLDTLSEQARRDTHSMVARGLASHDEAAAIVAWHYEQAGRLEEATDQWLLAVDEARAQQSMSTVASRLEHALRTGRSILERSKRQQLQADRILALVTTRNHELAIEEAQALLSADLATETRGEVLSHLAQSLWLTGRSDEAIESAAEALVLLDQNDEPSAFASALITRADALDARGQTEEALQTYRQALDIAREHGLGRLQLRAQNNLGLTYLGMARYTEAETWLEAGLETAQQTRNRWIEAILCSNMGRLNVERAQFESAERWFNQTLNISAEIGHEAFSALARQGLGLSHLERAQFPTAIHYFQRAERYFRQAGMKGAVGFNLINRARALQGQGAYDESLAVAEQGLDLVKDAFRGDEVYAYRITGRVYAETGEWERASESLQQAFDLAMEVGTEVIAAVVLIELSWVASYRGEPEEALQMLKRVHEMAEDAGNEALLANARFARGAALQRAGEPAEAIEDLQSAYESFHATGRAWNEALAASEAAVATHRADLPGAHAWLDRARDALDRMEVTDDALPRRMFAHARDLLSE